MKKTITVLVFLFLSFNIYSQVGLSQNLSEIKKEDVGGELMSNPDGGYIYIFNNVETQSTFIYLLDAKLDCYGTIVKPLSPLSFKYWKKCLSESWSEIDRKTWQIIRNDKRLVKCSLAKDREGKKVLVFSIQ